jgi:DNA-binding NarL/FixJ family response regulator
MGVGGNSMNANIEATRLSAVSVLAVVPSPRRVLVVDDHELVRYGVKMLYTELQGVPIEWLEAASLQEAIQLYAQSGEIDAVLLDLNLADCKGLQGLRLSYVRRVRSARWGTLARAR